MQAGWSNRTNDLIFLLHQASPINNKRGTQPLSFENKSPQMQQIKHDSYFENQSDGFYLSCFKIT
jgi:hypothetical protein